MEPKRNDPRTALLDAADRILSRKGLAGTTLEAVAAEAKMTKGGLLYHFPNKRELLSAAINRYENLFRAKCEAILAENPDHPQARVRAVLLAQFELVQSELVNEAGDRLDTRFGVLTDAGYRKIIAGMKKRMFHEVFRDARRPDKLAELLLLFDGLWLNRMFGPDLLPERMADAALRKLELLLDEYCREYA